MQDTFLQLFLNELLHFWGHYINDVGQSARVSTDLNMGAEIQKFTRSVQKSLFRHIG